MTTYFLGEGKHTFWDKFRSPTFRYVLNKAGTKTWKIEIGPAFVVGNQEATLIYIDCVYDYKSTNLWGCDAEIGIQMKIDNVDVYTKNMELCFNKNYNRHHFGTMVTQRESTLPKTLNFCVNIRIKSIVGIENSRLSCFSVPQKIDSEVTLIVGDHKLYIDKYVLLCFSRVFRGILYNGIFNDEIEIEDVTVEQCVAFLRLLYRQKEQLTKDTVVGVLKLSIRYDVPFLVTDCEEMLLSTDKMTCVEKLRISNLYHLSTLQEASLKRQQQFKHDMTIILDSFQNKSVPLVQAMEGAIAQARKCENQLQKFLADHKKHLELIKALKTAHENEPDQLETFQLQHPPEKRLELTLSKVLEKLNRCQYDKRYRLDIISKELNNCSMKVYDPHQFNTLFSNLFEITLSPQAPEMYHQCIASEKNSETMK